MTKQFQLDMLAGIARLAEAFPKAFFTYEARRKPLKVGIHDDIRAALGDAVANELRATLGYYCNNDAYLRQCATGAARIDLEGFLAGSVTAEQAEHAAELLRRRRAKRARKAALKPEPPSPQNLAPAIKPAPQNTPSPAPIEQPRTRPSRSQGSVGAKGRRPTSKPS
jgi:ProP effector